jgi:hypothetical protein
MDANIIILKEPKLEFSFHQKLEHPIDGLMLFGPNDLDKPSQPKSITYGLIGTKEGIKKFKAFSKLLNKPLFDDANEARMALWPMFPGFEAAFHCKYPEEPAWEHEIDDQKLLNDAKINDPNKRAYAVVEHYIKAISNASKNRDENIRVMFCIVPEEVYKNCRPMSRIYDGEGPKISKNVLNMYKSGQSSLSPDFNRNVYQLSEDFRKQLKARVMEFNIPVQNWNLTKKNFQEEDLHRYQIGHGISQ